MIYYYVSRNDNYDDIFEMAGYIKGRNGDLLTKINPNPIIHCKTGRANLIRIFQSEVLYTLRMLAIRRYWDVVLSTFATTTIAYGLLWMN